MIITENQRKRLNYLNSDPRLAFDPNKLYLEGRSFHRVGASGLGKLVMEIIPFSVIRSFGLAIDPMKKFRVAPLKITPVNRTRVRTISSVLDPRSWISHKDIKVYYSYSEEGRFFCYSVPILHPSSGVTVNGGANLPSQPALTITTKDTTARTRPPESEFGEFTSRKYTMNSSPRKYWAYHYDRTDLPMDCHPQTSIEDAHYLVEGTGPSALMSKASLDALFDAEETKLGALMQKDCLKMLSRVVPASRRYSAFRNVVELRDLPKSILSLRRAMENFHNSIQFVSVADRKWIFGPFVGKSIPGEYVSYHFGWKQIYNDVMDLLVKPIRAAQEVNRLMLRSGKPTTYRTSRKLEGERTTTPALEYDVRGGEESPTDETNHERNHELRLVVSATFDFPKVNIPQFRKQLFLEKVGVYPRVTDMYNLVPWSWLVDWATGLGDYVEAIDTINTDPSLYNWGLLTGITKGKITTTHKFKCTSTHYYRQLYEPGITQTVVMPFQHSSVLEYRLQIRKNIASAYDVKTILEPGGLSLYQQSILGAIMLSRHKIAGHG